MQNESKAAMRLERDKGAQQFQWISWWQPTPDPRPLTFPPNEAIIGWWVSGERDDASSICAMVRADGEDEARAAVLKDWPEADDWRFCETKDTPEIGGGRFVYSGWMLDRAAVQP